MSVIQQMKDQIRVIEHRIVATKGAGYLEALYQTEGVNDFNEGSLDRLKAQVAALTVANARLDGEEDAAGTIAREGLPAADVAPQVRRTSAPTPTSSDSVPVPVAGCPLPMPGSKPIQQITDGLSATQEFVTLMEGRKFHQGQALLAQHRGLMDQFANIRRRPESPEEAEAVYGYLVHTGQSYAAGVYWKRNRDLLTD